MKVKASVKKQVVNINAAKPVTNHIIPKVLGKQMIQRFKRNMKDLSKVKFEQGKEFDISLFKAFLKLKEIRNIRICNALNKDNSHTFVLIGLDANSNELYFKIKSHKDAQEKDGDLGSDEDGVGNMGNQCTEPPIRQESSTY